MRRLLVLVGLWWLAGTLLPPAGAEVPLSWSQSGAQAWQAGAFADTTLAGDRVVLARRLALEWDRTWSQLQGAARGLALGPAGELFIAGYGQQAGVEVAVLLKGTPEGQILWQRYAGSGRSSRAMDVAVDPRGRVYVTGYVWLAGHDYALWAYDAQGRPRWERRFAGSGDDQAQAVALDPRGRVVISGTSTLRDADVVTLQYDAAGRLLWQRRYDGGGGDRGWDVAVDASGAVYVAGSTLVAGQKDFLLLKYDAAGRLLWQRHYDGGGEEVATAVALHDQVALVGFSEGAGGTDLLIATYTPDGRLRWVRREDRALQGRAFAAAWDQEGDLLVTGSAQNAGERYLTLKLDPQGRLLWAREEAGEGFGRGYALATDALGHVFVSGVQGTGPRTLRYRDGFVPFGTFTSEVHRFPERVAVQSLRVRADLEDGALVAVVESGDSPVEWRESARVPLRSGEHRYGLEAPQAGRYVRVRFELTSPSALSSPALEAFTLYATSP